MRKIGLYLHIPFCRSKCPYCDFYSLTANDVIKKRYTSALRERVLSSCEQLQNRGGYYADTLYFGGGTPSALGAERLVELTEAAKNSFLTDGAEITVECNPYGLDEDFFKTLFASGINRISLGMQSAVDNERRALGRLADRGQVEKVIAYAQKAGFFNISLDIMLGTPGQTPESLGKTLDFCISAGVPHISAYILKLEENTYFYKNRNKLHLPDDDVTADMYLQMCEALENGGLMQYEISNFAKPGYESGHNLKYWHCEEYLGLGPSAHSFLSGKRFYFDRDINGFILGNAPIPDGDGGDFTEYAMLALRLCEGLREHEVIKRFGHPIPTDLRKKSEIFIRNGYMAEDEKGLRLTRKGFLLSNTILSEIL